MSIFIAYIYTCIYIDLLVFFRSLIHCCTVFRLACKGSYDNCHYMLFSNKSGSLVDMLNHQLTVSLGYSTICKITQPSTKSLNQQKNYSTSNKITQSSTN